jgi:ribosomal protein S18 acetylase RimI-like enzyme
MSRLEIVVARGGEYLDDAARIWAEATAFRDGDADVAPLEEARPLIQSAVEASPDALLLIAVAGDRAAVGFAACEPVGAAHDRRAELRYLGVRPDAWGTAVATRLLAAVRDQLRERGFVEAELWVNQENRRAIDLYRRAAWQPSAETRVNPRSGRLMQRYVVAIAASADSRG